jgi:phage/plasmid-associated DNA primase
MIKVLDFPEEEYECLALKCCSILHNLLKNRKFHNEGSVEDRIKKFEDRSNPLDKFLKEFCNTENPDGYIFKYDFEKKFNSWCKDNKFRTFSEVSIGKEMKERGFIQLQKNAFWLNEGKGGPLRAWIGISWRC